MSYTDQRRPPSPRRQPQHSTNNARNDMYAFGQGSDRHFEFRAGGQAPSFTGQRRHDATRPHRPNDRRRNDNRRGQGRGGYRRVATSDRAIFRARRSPTPEQLAGMNTGDSKYKPLAGVPDGSEEDEDSDAMDTEGSSDDGMAHPPRETSATDDDDDDHPRAKRAKVTSEEQDAEGDQKPKWSNPDPYTSLPPPSSEATGPKRDVVQMIRKARVENEARAKQVAQSDDFISLNFGDETDGKAVSVSDSSEDDLQILGQAKKRASVDHYEPPPIPSGMKIDRWPDPDRGRRGPYERDYSDGERSYSPPRHFDRSRRSRSPYNDPRDPHPRAYDPDFPPPPPSLLDAPPPPPSYAGRVMPQSSIPGSGVVHPSTSSALPPPAPPPQVYHDSFKRKRNDGTDTVGQFIPDTSSNSNPWMAYCTRMDIKPSDWLHDEILQFYYYVSPRESDRRMREDLIDRIRAAFHKEIRDVTVKTFGSSATNLYLPTGDIDIAVLSSEYVRSGYASIQTNLKTLRRLSNNVITRAGLGSFPQIIAHAKVPIIKFKDKKTGLPVDVSFENDSGVRALYILDNWLADYPASSKIIFVLKQFLKMRGLNEVNTGGLGGFSIICLVAFRQEILTRRNGRDWASKNLDLALLDFFEFYGNDLDIRRTGLDMRTMEFVSKHSWVGDRGASKPGRLLIVDPNNGGNDISGGSAKVDDVFRAFKEAGMSLRREYEMARSSYTSATRRSLLNCIIGANYDVFTEQRARLDRLHQAHEGLARNIVVPTSGGMNFPRHSAPKVVDLTVAHDNSLDVVDLTQDEVKAATYKHDTLTSNANAQSLVATQPAAQPPAQSKHHTPKLTNQWEARVQAAAAKKAEGIENAKSDRDKRAAKRALDNNKRSGAAHNGDESSSDSSSVTEQRPSKKQKIKGQNEPKDKSAKEQGKPKEKTKRQKKKAVKRLAKVKDSDTAKKGGGGETSQSTSGSTGKTSAVKSGINGGAKASAAHAQEGAEPTVKPKISKGKQRKLQSDTDKNKGKQRAQAFKASHPGMTCPEMLTKDQFKTMKAQAAKKGG